MDPPALQLTIENHYSEIDRVNREFNAFCAHSGVPDATRRAFNLAFDEFLNNIISYAYRDEERHTIEIRLRFSGPLLIGEILDDGLPFNPLLAPAPDLDAEVADRRPGGLGIHLVKGVMDKLEYRRNGKFNRVSFAKKIPAAE